MYHGDAEGNGVACGVTVGRRLLTRVDVADPRRPALRRAARPRTGTSSWQPRTTPSTRSQPRPARCCGPRTSARLFRPARSPAGTSRRRVGITGTPVIDPTRAEIFVVADELSGGHAGAHAGRPRHRDRARPSSTRTSTRRARTRRRCCSAPGSTLDDGRVVFGFGGNYGDCSNYHGWVVSVRRGGGPPTYFAVDAGPGERQGAIWMGGAAPVVDGRRRHLGQCRQRLGDLVLPHLRRQRRGARALAVAARCSSTSRRPSWASDNAADLDLSTAPALLADGQVGRRRQVHASPTCSNGGAPGRDRGSERRASASGCNDDIDGGAAAVGTTVYLPCLSGIIAVTDVGRRRPSLHLPWRSPTGGGPPIVAAGLVWTIGQDGVLYGLDPSTGAVQPAGFGRRRPPTTSRPPRSEHGLLLAPAANRVVAFRRRRPGRPRPPRRPPCPGDDPQHTSHHGLCTGPSGQNEPVGHRGGRRRLAGRRRRTGLAPAAPPAHRGPCRHSVSRQQQLEDRAHAGHDERDRHDHRRRP